MRSRSFLLLLIVFGLGLTVGWLIPLRGVEQAAAAESGAEAASEPAETTSASQPQPAGSLQEHPLPDGLGTDERRTIEVFRQASSSVVYVTTLALRRDFFSWDVFQIPQGSGSGFVWDDHGHIVTNFHVISEGNRIQVTLADRTEWDAELVGTAPNKDLAVIRIDAPARHLTPVMVGRSRDLVVGQRVLAIGNPFGLDHSLTVGVVSALGRELRSPGGRTIRDVIQSDAAINPGNSGGPLLDSSGRLVGVNTAIYSPSGASAGIGFAVPVDTVRRLVPQLIARGSPIQPGIGIVPLSQRYQERLGVEGVIVYQVSKGGPADRAGMIGIHSTRRRRFALGDIITAVNDKPVKNLDDLTYIFEDVGVGNPVTLTVLRDDKKRQVKLTLIALE
jgi:S1-C subfamily serine protease